MIWHLCLMTDAAAAAVWGKRSGLGDTVEDWSKQLSGQEGAAARHKKQRRRSTHGSNILPVLSIWTSPSCYFSPIIIIIIIIQTVFLVRHLHLQPTEGALHSSVYSNVQFWSSAVNKNVFSLRLNSGVERKCLSTIASLFQARRVATEKALSPNITHG